MNVVDSSGWLEYFADGPNADFFASPIESDETIVPSISVYEVFKRVLQQRDEGQALEAVAYMTQRTVIELDTPLALSAAKLSVLHKLPMATASSWPRLGLMGPSSGRRMLTLEVSKA